MELNRETKKAGFVPAFSRGDSGSRTHDLQIANLSLYQLSYIPIFGVQNIVFDGKFVNRALSGLKVCAFLLA